MGRKGEGHTLHGNTPDVEQHATGKEAMKDTHGAVGIAVSSNLSEFMLQGVWGLRDEDVSYFQL